jgi:hypothetical protein
VSGREDGDEMRPVRGGFAVTVDDRRAELLDASSSAAANV